MQGKCYSEQPISNIISMCLYQFLIAIRTGDANDPQGGSLAAPSGDITRFVEDITSLLMSKVILLASLPEPWGCWSWALSRSLSLMAKHLSRKCQRHVTACDIEDELMLKSFRIKRSKTKSDAREELADAQEKGDTEKVSKLLKRTVTISKSQIEDSKKVLRLMGACPCYWGI